jgi:uncharacterized membrane protein YdjX (TVP38/TMEM64 family)
MKKNIKPIFYLASIIIALFIFYSMGITNYIGLKELKMHRSALQHFVHNNYFYSVLIFISLYAIIVTFSIPIAALLNLTAGILFGAFWGIIYAIIAGSIGAIGIFLITRHVIGTYIQKRYHKKLTHFNEEMNAYGSNFLLIIRFLPFPFFITNILASLTNISLWTFTWTTIIGVIPDTCIYALAGAHLNQLQSMKDIISWPALSILLLLIFLSALPIIIKKINPKKGHS